MKTININVSTLLGNVIIIHAGNDISAIETDVALIEEKVKDALVRAIKNARAETES